MTGPRIASVSLSCFLFHGVRPIFACEIIRTWLAGRSLPETRRIIVGVKNEEDVRLRVLVGEAE